MPPVSEPAAANEVESLHCRAACDINGHLSTPNTGTPLFFPHHVQLPRLSCKTMAEQLLQVNGHNRPGNVRHPTAPSVMNAHFPGVGENASREAYEHGVQVIDEDKVFKYVFSRCK